MIVPEDRVAGSRPGGSPFGPVSVTKNCGRPCSARPFAIANTPGRRTTSLPVTFVGDRVAGTAATGRPSGRRPGSRRSTCRSWNVLTVEEPLVRQEHEAVDGLRRGLRVAARPRTCRTTSRTWRRRSSRDRSSSEAARRTAAWVCRRLGADPPQATSAGAGVGSTVPVCVPGLPDGVALAEGVPDAAVLSSPPPKAIDHATTSATIATAAPMPTVDQVPPAARGPPFGLPACGELRELTFPGATGHTATEVTGCRAARTRARRGCRSRSRAPGRTRTAGASRRRSRSPATITSPRPGAITGRAARSAFVMRARSSRIRSASASESHDRWIASGSYRSSPSAIAWSVVAVPATATSVRASRAFGTAASASSRRRAHLGLERRQVAGRRRVVRHEPLGQADAPHLRRDRPGHVARRVARRRTRSIPHRCRRAGTATAPRPGRARGSRRGTRGRPRARR